MYPRLTLACYRLQVKCNDRRLSLMSVTSQAGQPQTHAAAVASLKAESVRPERRLNIFVAIIFEDDR